MINTTFKPPSEAVKISFENLSEREAVVVGGGPAGLMAAQQMMDAGFAVHLYDAMPSVGRKFLLAGKGGLNLTHSEPPDRFATRFGERATQVACWLQDFSAPSVRDWAASLGIDTFVGSSGRVFPIGMKAAPLLRAWLAGLRAGGVVFHMRHRWRGRSPCGAWLFDGPTGPLSVRAGVTVLALGGASWPQLGSDGAWKPLLEAEGIEVADLLPANCGFDVSRASGAGARTLSPSIAGVPSHDVQPASGWSPYFADRFAGEPLKSIAVCFEGSCGPAFARRGEFVITKTGVEGSLVYAASAMLRDEIRRSQSATFYLDLLPDHGSERVLAEVQYPRGSRSLSSHLKSRLGLAGVKMALLHEVLGPQEMADGAVLARSIKRLPLRLVAARPVAESISSAGGVVFEDLDDQLMLRALPSVFCCGEMLDWEAPTGGYLITASLASGRWAGAGAAKWMRAQATPAP